MIKFVDYSCQNCGNIVSDMIIDTTNNEPVLCSICNAPMNKLIGGPIIKTKSRTERPYPTHLLGGGERARFKK